MDEVPCVLVEAECMGMGTIELVFCREGNAWVVQALNVDVSSFGEEREEGRRASEEALERYFEDTPSGEVVEVADVEVETVSVGSV